MSVQRNGRNRNVNMTDTERQLLDLLKTKLYSLNMNYVIATDQIPVVEEALHQAVLLYADMDSIKARQVLARNMQVYYSHAEMHQVLKDYPHVFIKGYAAAYYYNYPSLRQAGDVDILIRKVDADAICKRLSLLGYRRVNIDSNIHIVFKKDDIDYELHFSVNGIPPGEVGQKIDCLLKDTIETAHEVESEYGTIIIPDKFHHGLILLLHMAKHIMSSGIGLRHLCDWAVFVDKIPNFQEDFEEPLKSIGLWTFACQITALCSEYIGLEKPCGVGNWDSFYLNNIIEEILKSGNFGKKREDNKENWLTSSIGVGGVVRGSIVRQFLYNIKQIVILHWPRAEKNIFLLLVGGAYFSMRYLIRVLAGKRRKIKLSNMISNSKVRRRLFKEFHLFEVN